MHKYGILIIGISGTNRFHVTKANAERFHVISEADNYIPVRRLVFLTDLNGNKRPIFDQVLLVKKVEGKPWTAAMTAIINGARDSFNAAEDFTIPISFPLIGDNTSAFDQWYLRRMERAKQQPDGGVED